MNTRLSLRALFDEALNLDGDARQRWLAALRDTAPEQADRIQRMLAHDERRSDPFGPSVESLRQSLDFDADAWLGRDVGGFQLLRLLGQGGMGAVFLAQRSGEDFEQQVALKLLRGNWTSASALARFADERRILARLHHPNIATLIDAGTSIEGHPFIAMEYVDGVPFMAYCDAHKLGLSARLQLTRGLLSALAYAHRALVVHRDLKPGNILVTPDGTPKLLDFGIARLIETDAEAAATHLHPFTPDYASPEQMAGEPVGTSSDIFSLGVLLYQLCVGKLPWEAGSRARSCGSFMPPSARFRQLNIEQRSEIANQRSCAARQLGRRLRGDLGQVLARCLAVDPARRYGTVDALGRDLEAVVARQPPPGLHVSRAGRTIAFLRRHAWPVAVAALLVIGGTALLVQSRINEHRLEAERDRALAAAHKARTESAKSQQIAGFVQAMLAGIDPDKARGMDRSLMRLVLDSASQRAETELTGQPAVRVAVERTIARSYYSIGEYALAVQHFDDALAAADDAGTSVAERVKTMTSKARAEGNAGQSDLARATLEKARKLAEQLPATAAARLEAEATHAGFDCDDGAFQRCRDAYASLLPVMQCVIGATDAHTLEAMRGLAYAESKLAHYARAAAIYHKLISIDQEKYGKADSHTLGAINGLAITWLQQDEFAKAEELLKPAVKTAIKTFGRDHPLTINMLANLGGAIRQQPGRNAEARPYYEEVLKANEALYGKGTFRTAIARMNLAALLRDAGQLAKAEKQGREALNVVDTVTRSHSTYRAIFRDQFATVLLRRAKYRDAEEVLTQAWAILAKAQGFGPTHPAVQSVVQHFVELYTAWGKPEKAAQWQARLSQ